MIKFLLKSLATFVLTFIILTSAGIYYLYQYDVNIEFSSRPYEGFNVKFPKEGEKLKVAFVIMGSRGDLQPAGLVAQQFKKNGHSIVITSRRRYEDFLLNVLKFEEKEIVWIPELLEGSMEGLLANPVRVVNMVKGLIILCEYLANSNAIFLNSFSDPRFNDVNLVFFADLTFTTGQALAMRQKAPFIYLKYNHWFNTNEYSLISAPSATKSKSFFNWVYGGLFTIIRYYFDHDGYNEFLNKENLNEKSLFSLLFGELRYRYPTYCMFSPLLYPTLSNRPPWIKYVGPARFENEDKNEITPELNEFLSRAKGKTLFYIGFGSFTLEEACGNESHSVKQNIYNVVKKLDVYAVFLNRSFHEPKDSKHARNEKWFFGEKFPHNLLMKQVDLIVHHGGAGTMQTASMSGKPCLGLPIFEEQVLNCEMLKVYGIGVYLKIEDINEKSLEHSVKEALALENVEEKSKRIRDDRWPIEKIYNDMLQYVYNV